MTRSVPAPGPATAPLPEALAAHFARQATIGMPQLARLLPMDDETLRRHIADGRLACRFKGFGRVRRRRVFTQSDILQFLQALEDAAPCPSIATRDRPITGTISKSAVIVFPARPNCGMNVTRRPSKKRAKPRPDASSSRSAPPAPSR